MRPRYMCVYSFFLVALCFFVYNLDRLHADDTVYRLRFLPQYIATSYFPSGDEYMIPVDSRTQSLIERAGSYEAEGNYRQAKRYYATAHKRAAAPAVPYIAFKLCTLEEQSNEAIACMKELIERAPGFPLIDAVRFELAFRLFLQGNAQDALNYLYRIEQNETGAAPIFAPSALYFSGIIEAEHGSPDRALGFFKQAIQSMNETGGEDYRNIYPGVYLEMAKSHFALNSHEEAESLLIALYGTAPLAMEQSEALWYLGEVYTAQAQWDMAYAAYSALIEQYGGTPYSSRAQARLNELDANQFGTLSIEPLYDESLLTGQYGRDDDTTDEALEEQQEPGAFAIQLGSFSREDNAKVYAEQLGSLGYPSFLVQAEVDGVYYYRVRVGFYTSREEAQGVLLSLKELGYGGYILEDK